MIRLLVVDDHQLVREGLAALLAGEPDLAVTGLAGSGEAALDAIRRDPPDVLLLDLRMPGIDGLGVLRALRHEHPAVRTIVLTTFDDDIALLEATALGASGFLLKDLPRSELVEAIRAVHRGERALRPTVGDAVRRAVAPQRPDADRSRPVAPLTAREQEVLRLMAGGLGNKEIARALHLAEGTVKNHVSVILDKFGVTDRTRAVLKALERGLL